MSLNNACAEFIGYQEDTRVQGWRAYYIIHAPGFERNESTVFAPTLNELGIPIPPTPEYEPKENTQLIWFHKCQTCKITWASASHAVTHKRKLINHDLASIKVPLANVIPFDQKPSEVWVRDDVLGRLVLEVPDTPVTLTLPEKPEEKTQEINLEEVRKLESEVEPKEQSWSPWALKIAKDRGFKLGEKR